MTDAFSQDEIDRHNAAWIEEIIRLKLAREDGTVDEARFAARRAQILDDIRIGRVPLGDGPDTERLRISAHVMLDEPSGASTADDDVARQGAVFLERLLRLKLGHEAGRLTDADYRTRAAMLGGEISAFDDSGEGWA